MSVAAIFELTTPYSEDDVFDVAYDQTADVVILAHPKYPPQKLVRFSHTNWTCSDAIFGTQVPPVTGLSATANQPVTTDAHNQVYAYTVTSINAETGQESGPCGSVTCSNDLSLAGNFNLLAWAAVAGSDTYPVYKGNLGVLGFIGLGTSDGLSFRDDNIAPDYSDTYPRVKEVFNAANLYPATVTFFGQRCFFARTFAQPNAIFGSQVGDFFNFNASRPAQADDALTFGVLARRVNAIQHMVPMKDLVVFTTDSVFAISGSNGGAITPSSIDITPQSYRGSSKVRPVTVDDVIFFLTALGARLRTLNYTFERDGYRGNDITVFARHFFQGFQVLDMAWLEEPSQTVWLVRSDGKMIVLTWMAEQDIWGWSLCQTDGYFESCCAVTENGESYLYAVVRRYIQAQTVLTRAVERMSSPNWTRVEDATYLDAARTYVGPPISTIRGLAYLEGAHVSALADGSVVDPLIVTNGRVTLPHAASKITVGLPYDSWVRTLPLVQQSKRIGSTKGAAQTLSRVIVSLEKSRGVEAGTGKNLPPGQFEPLSSDDEIGSIYPIVMREIPEGLAENPALHTGSFECDLGPGDWTEGSATVVVRQRNPLPMFITGIVPSLEVGG